MDGSTEFEHATAAETEFNRAVRLWKSRDQMQALAVLEQVADGEHGEIDDVYAKRVLRKLVNYLTRFNWIEAERVAHKIIERFPSEAFGHRYLGEALLKRGQVVEAKAALERAVQLDLYDEDARFLLNVAVGARGQRKNTNRWAAHWPIRRTQFNIPERVVERFVLSGHPNKQFIDGKTAFMALGSCFAVNLAQGLEASGHEVYWEWIGEEINSTYANRYLLDWLEHGPIDDLTTTIHNVYGPERRERLRQGLKSSQVLVLTLGVAPCFFELGTGKFVFSSLGTDTGRAYLEEHCEMRTTSVAENAANLEAILDSAVRIAGHDLQVVLTVSPVPLAGSTEYPSAIIADCLSKSTLRLACEEVLRKRPDAIYWPSFEIVRWLGAHYSQELPPVFGADDSRSRHVSRWIVDLNVKLFIAHHSRAGQSEAETDVTPR